jgi:hypothetical protein
MEKNINFFSDRRFVPIFFVTMMVLSVTVVLLTRSSEEFHPEDLLYALPAVGIVMLAFIWREVRWARTRRQNCYKSSPLSRDELRKARSKLTRAKH